MPPQYPCISSFIQDECTVADDIAMRVPVIRNKKADWRCERLFQGKINFRIGTRSWNNGERWGCFLLRGFFIFNKKRCFFSGIYRRNQDKIDRTSMRYDTIGPNGTKNTVGVSGQSQYGHQKKSSDLFYSLHCGAPGPEDAASRRKLDSVIRQFRDIVVPFGTVCAKYFK